MAPLREEALSIQGRYAYFQALQQFWPEILGSLRDQVLPSFEPRWQETPSGAVFEIEPWSKVKADPGRRNLVLKLEAWAEEFLITEEWIVEAALDTLTTHSIQVRNSGNKHDYWPWMYTPRGIHPHFEPILTNSFWYPPSKGGLLETWEQFRKRMDGEFKRQLSAYRTTVETMFGVGREKRIQIEAGWAARYQKGESIADMAQTIDVGNLADPEQAIFKAIVRFARSVGLKLRKRGVRRKRTTASPRP